MVTSSRDTLEWAAQQETPTLTVDDVEAGPDSVESNPQICVALAELLEGRSVGHTARGACLEAWRKLVRRFDPQAVGRKRTLLSVNLVNVDLVEPICEGFACSAVTFCTDIAGVVVAVGEDCDLMYGSVVWCIVQGAYAQYALATCSLTNLFSLSLGEAGTIPIVEGPAAVSAGSRRSLDLKTRGRRDGWARVARVSLESNWPKLSAREL